MYVFNYLCDTWCVYSTQKSIYCDHILLLLLDIRYCSNNVILYAVLLFGLVYMVVMIISLVYTFSLFCTPIQDAIYCVHVFGFLKNVHQPHG